MRTRASSSARPTKRFAPLMLCVITATVVVASPRVARADLRDLAARVADAFRLAGAEVKSSPTRFLNDDETVSVVLPAGGGGACTSVALLGARGMSFRGRLSVENDDEPVEDGRTTGASVAGALLLTRCGEPGTARVVITSDAGRGAVEIVIARAKGPMPTLTSVLPERGGSSLPHQFQTEPGELPALVPASTRADVAEVRARHDSATVEPRASIVATAEGAGSAPIVLEPGCHRIELFGIDLRPRNAGRRGRLDLDGELRDSDDELIARDRTEAADARLEACVGETTNAEVSYVGSVAGAPVVLTHGRWPIPARLPTLWGNAPRARMASALLARHATLPDSDAVFVAQGPSGLTTVPITVEPGACYMAVAAITHGSARGLGLRAVIGAREIADERGVGGVASALAFCAEERDAVRVAVDARGTALAWGLALFRVQGAVWGGVR